MKKHNEIREKYGIPIRDKYEKKKIEQHLESWSPWS